MCADCLRASFEFELVSTLAHMLTGTHRLPESIFCARTRVVPTLILALTSVWKGFSWSWGKWRKGEPLLGRRGSLGR